jgi:hypothetical protein
MASYEFNPTGNDREYIPNQIFTGKGFRVSVDPINKQGSKFLFGIFRISVLIKDKWINLADRYEMIPDQIVLVPFTSIKLNFWQYPWMTGYKVTIDELTIGDLMSASYQSSTPPQFGSVNTTVPTNTANVTLSLANPNRIGGGLIVNTSATRNLWVLFGATAATTTEPSVLVPKGRGNIDIPDGYTGQINGIWEGADTNGKASIWEFL